MDRNLFATHDKYKQAQANHRVSLFIRSRFVLRPLSQTRFYF